MLFNFSIFIYTGILFFLLSLVLFLFSLFFLLSNKIYIVEWIIFNINSCDIFFPLILDKYGLLFSSTVLFISGNVFLFSNYYMESEIYVKRFLYLVICFVLSMNFLIFIPHMMGLLLGWDGLGLTSFLLVIYYQNPKSLGAGMLTAIMNRVGDVFLLLSIGWSVNQGHWMVLFMWDNFFSVFVVYSIMIAGMTKSAQIPFSSWLPAAMAAPTPVSALVHSSTLVTAGVFLLIRFYPFLSCLGGFNMFILFISSLTMFVAGLSALFECDMKKIVALSTLSQLGVMMASIGIGFIDLAFFHLVTHALFKALLFICVGSLIHLHHHSQDLRSMGSLVLQMPLTMTCLSVSNMALCGLPFLSGFYSKDLIIEMSLYNSNNFFILILFISATMMTCSYSIRLALTGILSMNMSINIQYVDENSLDNTTSMILLSLGGIFGGCVINWIFISPFSEPVISNFMKLSVFVLIIASGFFMYLIMAVNVSLSKNFSFINNMASFLFFMTPVSTQMLLSFPLKLGKYNISLLDQGWSEKLSAQGLFNSLHKMFTKLQVTQGSLIMPYLSFIFFLVFLLLALMI